MEVANKLGGDAGTYDLDSWVIQIELCYDLSFTFLLHIIIINWIETDYFLSV